MFSKNMRATCGRLLILGFFSACLVFFSFSNNVESVFASVCYQDCEASRAMCDDSCMTSCGDTDEACENCQFNCSQQYNRCMGQAVFCTNGGTISHTPQCSVDFGTHCPIIGGVPDCSLNTHNGYFQTCNRIGYQNGCIVCPAGEFCTNGNTDPPPHCP